MGGIVPSKPSSTAATPAPAPAPVLASEPTTASAPASDAVRRKRLAEGRTDITSTTGGDNTGATKVLLGN